MTSRCGHGLLLTGALTLVCAVGTGCGTSPSPASTGTVDAAFRARAQAVATIWHAKGFAKAWTSAFVPLGDLTVISDQGFSPNENLKASFGNGYVRADVPLPNKAGSGTVSYADGTTASVPTVSALDAYAAMVPPQFGDCPPREGSSDTCDWATVTAATPGTTSIQTTRGPATVPAWLFTVEGLADPIARVAVAPSAMAELPDQIVDEAPPAGLRSAQGLLGTDGSTIRFQLGLGACDRDARALVWENSDIVVVGGTASDPDPGTACVAMLELRPVTVTTTAPIAARPIVDAATGQPLRAAIPGSTPQ